MIEHISPIPARVYNAAVGGHVCGPEDVDFGQKVVHLIKYDRAGNEVSFESQVTQANKIYVIHDDFTLSSNVTIPANCILEFDGGSISGNKITYNNTKVIGNYKGYINSRCVGFVSNDVVDCYMYGAKGDGTTDDTRAMNDAVQCGAKSIYFPEGNYLISNYIFVPSNVRVYGAGNATNIINNVESGWGKGGFALGYCSADEKYPSQYSVIGYRCTISDKIITLLSLSDISNFNIGDIVVIRGSSTFQDGNYRYRALFVSKIVSISGSAITLEHNVTNPLFADEDNIYIENFSTFHNSTASDDIGYIQNEYWCYEENTCHIVENVTIEDLCIELIYPNTGSGQYGIFINGYNCIIRNVNIKNGTTPLGSNFMAFSLIEDCRFEYSAGLSDLAELQICNIINNCIYTAKGRNNNHYGEGLTFGNGYNCNLINTTIYGNPGVGKIEFGRNPYGSLINCKIFNICMSSGSKTCVNGPIDGNITIQNCYIDVPNYSVVSQGGIVYLQNNVLSKMDFSTAYDSKYKLIGNIIKSVDNGAIMFGNTVNGISSKTVFINNFDSISPSDHNDYSTYIGCLQEKIIKLTTDLQYSDINLSVTYGESSNGAPDSTTPINLTDGANGKHHIEMLLVRITNRQFRMMLYVDGKLTQEGFPFIEVPIEVLQFTFSIINNNTGYSAYMQRCIIKVEN